MVSPFLEPVPDPWVRRGLATILLLAFVTGMVLASVRKVQETIIRSFDFRPLMAIFLFAHSRPEWTHTSKPKKGSRSKTGKCFSFFAPQ